MMSCTDALAKTGCENLETTVRKRILSFAGLVARMRNAKLPKRVMLGEPEGGEGYGFVREQEQDWTGCFEQDLSMLNLPTETKQSMLASKIPESSSEAMGKRQIST